MNLDELIQKTPRPILVLVVLMAGIAFFIYNEPLKDECEVQSAIFKKNMAGLLTSTKVNKKVQFPQLKIYWKDRCKEGNSIGSCDDYFEGLRKMSAELKRMNDNCQLRLSEESEDLATVVSHGVHIMALVAWGEKPPEALSGRAGWLNESHLRTFCYLKDRYKHLAGEEALLSLRERVYREYPDNWPEQTDFNKLLETTSSASGSQSGKSDRPVDQVRPRAYKTQLNPTGTLTKEDIYQRSLFSIRCDLYM